MTQSPLFQMGWSLLGLCILLLSAWWVGRDKRHRPQSDTLIADIGPKPVSFDAKAVTLADMENELIINTATWGPVDKSKPPQDVTGIIQRHVRRDKDGRMWIDMEVSRFGELGDPFSGHPKELSVSYSGFKKIPEWTPPYRLRLPAGTTFDNSGPSGRAE